MSSAGATGGFDATVQQCSPCPKGEECATPPCVVCVPCKPGFYKAAVSVDACAPCPADTYNAKEGGQDLSACQPCQARATTRGLTARTSQVACVCDAQYYAVVTPTSSTCANCPKGATCDDRSCAVRNMSSQSCPGGKRIAGNWTLDASSGAVVLLSCPPGHTLRSRVTAGSEDLQECQACQASQYILNPDADACQTCPPGLKCDSTHVVTPAIANSTWARNGSVYRLTGCPAGYSVSSAGATGGFDATVQQCSPCPKGEELSLIHI